jgi:hypothetical protein
LIPGTEETEEEAANAGKVKTKKILIWRKDIEN